MFYAYAAGKWLRRRRSHCSKEELVTSGLFREATDLSHTHTHIYTHTHTHTGADGGDK